MKESNGRKSKFVDRIIAIIQRNAIIQRKRESRSPTNSYRVDGRLLTAINHCARINGPLKMHRRRSMWRTGRLR